MGCEWGVKQRTVAEGWRRRRSWPWVGRSVGVGRDRSRSVEIGRDCALKRIGATGCWCAANWSSSLKSCMCAHLVDGPGTLLSGLGATSSRPAKRGHGTLPRWLGCAPGGVGAAWPSRQSTAAEGARSSSRMDGRFHHSRRTAALRTQGRGTRASARRAPQTRRPGCSPAAALRCRAAGAAARPLRPSQA